VEALVVVGYPVEVLVNVDVGYPVLVDVAYAVDVLTSVLVVVGLPYVVS
jgi:hypothetical protein